MVYRTAERWSSRVSVILAVTGSAVGLGNFLRFPNLAALYGGGAILIPYFVALLLIGLPFMWVEWALGRYGGIWGRHSLPGIFDRVTRRAWGKYLGVLGLYLPFVIVVYYLFVESWTLGYTFLSAIGDVSVAKTPMAATALFNNFLGISGATLAHPSTLLWIALGVTLLVNMFVVYYGAESGIEKTNMVAMPLLFVVSAGLLIAIFNSPGAGKAMDVLWRVDFAALRNPEIWLAAVGQVLFTLSLAMGTVVTYSSYLRKDDDVALGGLTAVSLNTFGEIILGASIIFPVALLFFNMNGPAMSGAAQQGPFALPFVALPQLLRNIHIGNWQCGNQAGMLWFLLLFFAGITSSVSLLQPILAFFKEELGWERRKATLILFGLTLLCLAPVVLLQNHSFLNEIDFWAVNLLLPIAALVEVLVFLAVLGISRGWEGITFGAFIRVPRFFKFVIQYVLPLLLVAILGGWAWRFALPMLTLTNTDATLSRYIINTSDIRFLIGARILMGVVFLALLVVLRFAWQHRLDEHEPELAPRADAPPAEEESDVI